MGKNIDPDDVVELKGPAGSISIHHDRIAHGSAANTSSDWRRILFFEMEATDAFPINGSLTQWDDIEDYNTRMLCGKPTITPAVKIYPFRYTYSYNSTTTRHTHLNIRNSKGVKKERL